LQGSRVRYPQERDSQSEGGGRGEAKSEHGPVLCHQSLEMQIFVFGWPFCKILSNSLIHGVQLDPAKFDSRATEGRYRQPASPPH
jgi:hypothetical protein